MLREKACSTAPYFRATGWLSLPGHSPLVRFLRALRCTCSDDIYLSLDPKQSRFYRLQIKNSLTRVALPSSSVPGLAYPRFLSQKLLRLMNAYVRVPTLFAIR